MGVKLGVAVLVGFSLLLLVSYPKTAFEDDGSSMHVCNCLGSRGGNLCFGLRTDCAVLEKKDSDEIETVKTGSDITLLIDNSKSMEGERLLNAKKAAEQLIRDMKEYDNMQIIGFDEQARTIVGFTNDIDVLNKALQKIGAREETYYIPALMRATSSHLNRDRANSQKIIFLSDGEPSKQENLNDIYNQVYDLAGKGICLYTIGYGVDMNPRAVDILKGMAKISRERAGCGNYYQVAENLEDVFGEIYFDQFNQELKIDLQEPKETVYDSEEVPISLSTNIDSVCKYELNGLHSEIIFNNSFSLKARPGLNTIRIVCRSSYGKEQSKEITRNFFHRSSIKDLFNKEPKTSEVRPLKEEEIEFLLKDIIEQQKLNIVRKTAKQDDGTLVYILVENTKPVPIRNLIIEQTIPQAITQSTSDISSTDSFQIVSMEPIRIQYRFIEIAPDEIITFSYFIDKPIDNHELSQIKTAVTYDEVSGQDIEKVIVAQNRTKGVYDVVSGYDVESGRTKGLIRLSAQQPVENAHIYLNVPKCMAYDLNKIYFSNRNYRIISKDPIVLWQLENSGEAFDIEYELDKELEEECEKRLSVLTIGEPVEKQAEEDSPMNIFIVFLPLLTVPLIIIFFANRKLLESNVSPGRKKFIKAVIVLILSISLIFFVYPKERFKDDKFCECFGVSSREQCYGLSHTCSVPKSFVEAENKVTRCPAGSCDALRAYLNTDPYSNIEQGVDLLLVLDHSKSMEAEKMDQAKPALINLITQIGESDRIALMKFDDSAELVQSFTTNRDSTRANINNINIGLQTQYIPALSEAHQTFLNYGDRKNQWQIIFVSDGAPGDEDRPNSIYQKVREMVQDDICINTIGFGSEITFGSEAETILKEMAKISNDATGCGVYYYSPKEMEQLSLILGKMYAESVVKKIGFEMEVNINSLEISKQEAFESSAQLYSKVNGRPVPGSFQIGTQEYCSPEADVKLILASDTNELSEEYEYKAREKAYSTSVMDLPPGKYNATLTATLVTDTGQDCSIYDEISMGSLDVVDLTEFNSCSTDECYEVNRYLFSKDTKKLIQIYITDYAFVPQNVSIAKDTTIVWKNIGERAHTVTSGFSDYDGLFHSGELRPGDSFNYTFNESISLDYFDNLSRSIRGQMSYNRTKNYSIGNFSLEYKENIDLALLIDRSGSMSGQKLENVKNAAKRLVDIVYPGDRISIVRFADDANIAASFTDDNALLKSTVDRLYAAGSTRYIPALQKLEENYALHGNPESGRVVIFLSDGEPWDKEGVDGIFDYLQKLVDQGICIYAIGYGEEVYPGSKSEQILQNMVSMSQQSADCGVYKYSPSDKIRLSKIFGSIYHEAIGELEGLKLEPFYSSKILFDNESLLVKTKVKSSFNNNYLPGTSDDNGYTLCGPPAKVTMTLSDEDNIIIEKNADFVGGATGYLAEFQDLLAGDYVLTIKAESTGSDGQVCNYVGSEEANIVVLSTDEWTVDPFFVISLVLIFSMLIYVYVSNK